MPVNPDLPWLQQLYSAWCLHFPFDNIRKMMALFSGNMGPLPGLDVNDFFINWLRNGSGATCWPMANAFYELLSALGYNTTRIAGAMRDMGIQNHGSVKVTINNQDYLAEASLLVNTILPMDNDTFISYDPVYPLELERDKSSHLLWLISPPSQEYYYCRLENNPVSYSVFEERYEASRTTSIFNQRLYARRNYPDKLVLLWGNIRYLKTQIGVEYRELERDELCEALHFDIGISYDLITEWVATGSLDSTFESPSGARPTAITLRPPSQR